jgi:hypothetical protein
MYKDNNNDYAGTFVTQTMSYQLRNATNIWPSVRMSDGKKTTARNQELSTTIHSDYTGVFTSTNDTTSTTHFTQGATTRLVHKRTTSITITITLEYSLGT